MDPNVKRLFDATVTAINSAREESMNGAHRAAETGDFCSGVATIIAAANPENSTTHIQPIADMPVKGREDVRGFFPAACITRDAILMLIALNKQFSLGLDAPLELLSMAHPMVAKAMAQGHMEFNTTNAADGRRVVRDVVEVGAGGAAGNDAAGKANG